MIGLACLSCRIRRAHFSAVVIIQTAKQMISRVFLSVCSWRGYISLSLYRKLATQGSFVYLASRLMAMSKATGAVKVLIGGPKNGRAAGSKLQRPHTRSKRMLRYDFIRWSSLYHWESKNRPFCRMDSPFLPTLQPCTIEIRGCSRLGSLAFALLHSANLNLWLQYPLGQEPNVKYYDRYFPATKRVDNTTYATQELILQLR